MQSETSPLYVWMSTFACVHMRRVLRIMLTDRCKNPLNAQIKQNRGNLAPVSEMPPQKKNLNKIQHIPLIKFSNQNMITF